MYIFYITGLPWTFLDKNSYLNDTVRSYDLATRCGVILGINKAFCLNQDMKFALKFVV